MGCETRRSSSNSVLRSGGMAGVEDEIGEQVTEQSAGGMLEVVVVTLAEGFAAEPTTDCRSNRARSVEILIQSSALKELRWDLPG